MHGINTLLVLLQYVFDGDQFPGICTYLVFFGSLRTQGSREKSEGEYSHISNEKAEHLLRYSAYKVEDIGVEPMTSNMPC